jgi:hypothetical protein
MRTDETATPIDAVLALGSQNLRKRRMGALARDGITAFQVLSRMARALQRTSSSGDVVAI